MCSISTVKFSILLNVAHLISLEALGRFGKGILYLCLLFDIVIEALSRMLDVAAIAVQFLSFSVGNTVGISLKVSHLGVSRVIIEPTQPTGADPTVPPLSLID